ncbi:hypothetical protein B0T17DRAFT_529976 [Bombardia bombarda]|uniref:Uncharacterized protein n=1 Tax=Bombardia bombarda TaxID=252184 RepID=A0AA40CA20_9PEZI|nr:hypothetical protein B0T17DRAFT_529976 [Bombardia bombarda]
MYIACTAGLVIVMATVMGNDGHFFWQGIDCASVQFQTGLLGPSYHGPLISSSSDPIFDSLVEYFTHNHQQHRYLRHPL